MLGQASDPSCSTSLAQVIFQGTVCEGGVVTFFDTKFLKRMIP